MASTVAPGTAAPAAVSDIPLILPPQEIRKYIDYTANAVRSKGSEFERQVRERNAHDSRFAFFNPTNPYHEYYRQRVLLGDDLVLPDASSVPVAQPEAAASSSTPTATTAAASSAAPEPAPEPAAPVKPSLHERLLAAVHRIDLPDLPTALKPAVSESEPPVRPPPLPARFAIKQPSHASAVDLDLVKLTALTAARNGRRFLAQLSALTRKQTYGEPLAPGEPDLASLGFRPGQFDFITPTHPFFVYFQALVETYAAILVPPRGLVAELTTTLSDLDLTGGEALLQMLNKHARWARHRLARAAEEQTAQEEETVSMLAVDWQNFSLVGTVTFAPEEDPYLPEPQPTIEAIDRALELQEQAAAEAAADAAAHQAAQDAAAAAEITADADADTGAAAAAGNGAQGKSELDTVTGAMRDEDAPVAVLSGAAAAAAAAQATAQSATAVVLAAAQTQVCPICKTLVPTDKLQEHMRIELMDPHWREQRQLLEQRKVDTALAGDAAMASYLARMSAQKREGAAANVSAVPGSVPPPVHRPPPSAANPLHTASVPAGPAPAPAPSATSTAPAPRSAAAGFAPPAPFRGVAPAPPATAAGFVPPAPMPVSAASASASAMATATVGDDALAQQLTKRARVDPVSSAAEQDVALPPLAAPSAAAAAAAAAVAAAAAAAAAAPSLVAEDEWLSRHPAAASFTIQAPAAGEGADEYGCSGQTVVLELADGLRTSVNDVKARISELLGGFPPKKMKVSTGGVYFNKDTNSLAAYNVVPGATLVVGLKTRGGRKA
jgi:splicing factor 3A subunit 1